MYKAMIQVVSTVILGTVGAIAPVSFADTQTFKPDYILDVQEIGGKAHYNGLYPGPVMRVSPGGELKVELINSLPALNDDCTDNVNNPHGLNTTNLHTHGLHVSPDLDSSGKYFADNVFVALVPEDQNIDCGHDHGHRAHSNFIKGSAQYRFELPEDHMTGTFWYHAHKHGSTASQVADGLAGPLIVEDRPGELPDYISQANEKIFVIGDDGLYLAHEAGGGEKNPTIQIAPGEVQRWRIINATSEAGEAYQLPRISLKGLEVFLIAFDGFMLDQRIPINLENIETPWLNPAAMTSGNRLDLVVRAPVNYQEQINDSPVPKASLFASLFNEPLASVVDFDVSVNGEAIKMAWTNDNKLPGSGLASFGDETLSTREIAFTDDETIDGESYTGQVEQKMTLDTAEQWTVRNTTDDLHIYHIHVNPFFVTHINDVELPQASPLRRWQDTIGTPVDGGSITFKTRFEKFTGKFVIHCHVLEHEDEGMMQIVQVVSN